MKLLLVLLFSISGFTQTERTFLSYSTGAGNGGHPIEDRAYEVLMEINTFFKNKDNQKIFPEIDFNLFFEALNKTVVVADDKPLKDVYGNRRCLVNIDYYILIDEKCWGQTLIKKQDHYSILFHELLGMIGVEVAGKYKPSKYSISARLEKYVVRANNYKLVNVNSLKSVEAIAIECVSLNRSFFWNKIMGLGQDRARTLFLIKLNENKVLDIFTKNFEPDRWDLWTFERGSERYNEYTPLDASFFDISSNMTTIDLHRLHKNSEKGMSFYERDRKRLYINFEMTDSDIDHFEIPLSDILLLNGNRFNEITVEAHLENSSVEALSCKPYITRCIENIMDSSPWDWSFYSRYSRDPTVNQYTEKASSEQILSIQNYFGSL